MACIGSRTFCSDAYPAMLFPPVSSALLRSLAPSVHVQRLPDTEAMLNSL